jgi:hypothetical protein
VKEESCLRLGASDGVVEAVLSIPWECVLLDNLTFEAKDGDRTHQNPDHIFRSSFPQFKRFNFMLPSKSSQSGPYYTAFLQTIPFFSHPFLLL